MQRLLPQHAWMLDEIESIGAKLVTTASVRQRMLQAKTLTELISLWLNGWSSWVQRSGHAPGSLEHALAEGKAELRAAACALTQLPGTPPTPPTEPSRMNAAQILALLKHADAKAWEQLGSDDSLAALDTLVTMLRTAAEIAPQPAER